VKVRGEGRAAANGAATHRDMFGVLAVTQLAMCIDAKGPQAAALCMYKAQLLRWAGAMTCRQGKRVPELHTICGWHGLATFQSCCRTMDCCVTCAQLLLLLPSASMLVPTRHDCCVSATASYLKHATAR
jgi:hypothetical protein